MQQQLPRRSKPQQAVGADKQRHAQLLLQSGHRPADSGMAGIEGPGRLRIAPVLRCGDEQPQPRKFNDGSLSGISS